MFFLASIHHSTSDYYRIITHNSLATSDLVSGQRFEHPEENYNGFTLPEPEIVVLIKGCPR